MQARIVTVADTFDAMTTTRPYQQAMETDYVRRDGSSSSRARATIPVVVGRVRAGLRRRGTWRRSPCARPRGAGRAALDGRGAVNRASRRRGRPLGASALVAARCSSGASNSHTFGRSSPERDGWPPCSCARARARGGSGLSRGQSSRDRRTPTLRDGLGVALMMQGQIREALGGIRHAP